jgi:MFS family permease
MAGVFLSPLNVNFTSVALPTLREHFAVSIEQVAWVGTAYFIPVVVLMPLYANLGQRWGLRRIYALGLALLSVGAFMAALAPNFGWLLLSRAIQGSGWSALFPLALILIRAHFPAEQQGEVMGSWESAVGVAAIVGPVLGGMIVALSGWRAVYGVLGVLAGLGALIAVVSIPARSERPVVPTFDWPGALSLTLALLLLLLGVAQKAPLLLLTGGLVLLVWLWLARRSSEPFVAPSIFRNRRFVSASTAATLRMLIALAVVMSLPLFLEEVQDLSPAVVGILLPIYSVFLFLGARVGFGLMTIGVAMLILLDIRINLAIIAVALAVRGLGTGLAQSPSAQVATNAVRPTQAAMAAGLYSMVRYSGLALGSALVGIFLQARLVHYGSDGSGPEAVPAFRELFAVLALLGVTGLALSWLMGGRNV